MDRKVKVLVLRTAGTNCDAETVFAFKYFGAQVDAVHVNRLLKRTVSVHNYHILAIPGGFTYGDDIESGRILANELRLKLGADLGEFIGDGKLIIGICNGFQVLVKAGILPGPLFKQDAKRHDAAQVATLVNNDSGKFEDRWCYLKTEGHGVWLEGLKGVVYFPVAHAEGKFLVGARADLEQLVRNGQVAFRYCSAGGGDPVYPENPNGSVEHIAGVTDRTGRILGLMPHPERHFFFHHHPRWSRMDKAGLQGDGARIFQNGVNYVTTHLLGMPGRSGG